MLAQKRRHYLRVDGVELSQHHSIDLVQATRRGVICQGLPSGRPSKHEKSGWSLVAGMFIHREDQIHQIPAE